MESSVDLEKIHMALRSLYRFREMKDANMLEILLENECDLLRKRVAMLNAHEIFELIKLWPDYLTQQMALDVIDNQQFEDHLLTLN